MRAADDRVIAVSGWVIEVGPDAGRSQVTA